MSNLGPQKQNASFQGLLQVPGGVTSSLQMVTDGSGNPTGLSLSTTAAVVSTLVSATAQNLYGGVAGAIVYQSAAGATSFVTPGTTGQLLSTNGGLAPTFVTVDANYVDAVATSGDSMTGALNMTGNLITNLATPVASTDAATKAYVDSIATGLQVKTAATCATTTNLASLSGLLTIDGVTVTAGQRVLVKDQTASQNNGIYVAAAGAWSRATDADSWAELVGAAVFVTSGSTNGSTTWVCNVAPNGTLGTTAVTFVQFGASSSYTAGTGLTLAGNQFSITAPVTVALGGTGVTSLTGIPYGNSTSAFTVATGSQIASQIGSNAVAKATNIAGGGANRIAYQAATDTTSFLSTGILGQFLKSNGPFLAPSFAEITAIPSVSSASFTSAITRPINDLFGDVLNVADFGALTDGSDAGPAIQNAINAASQYGRPLLFYGATYTIKTAIEIKNNVRLQGTAGTTLFIAADCTDGPSFGGAARQVYTNTGAYNISLDSIIFKSTTSGLTKSISVAFQDVTGLNINNCEFRDFGNSTYHYYSQGFILFGGNDVVITNNIFTGNSGDGCAISNNVTDFVFSGNTSSFNGDWGFAIVDGCNNGTVSGNLFLDNTSTATGATRSNDITFTGNICRNCEHGVRIARFPGSQTDQKYITISDNVIYGCGTGISVEDMYQGSNYTISGNTIMYSGGAGVSISNCENGVISANQITSSGSEGIVFVSYTGSNSGLATVTGNSIHVCTIGIRQVNAGGGVSVISVSNNLITGNSSIPIDLLNAYQGTGYNLPTNYSPAGSGGPGGRLLSTTYTNSKPYPIQVVVTVSPNAPGLTDTLQGLVNGNVVVGQGSVGIGAVNGPPVSVSLIVPPGSTYQVRGYLGVLTTLSLWYEYQ